MIINGSYILRFVNPLYRGIILVTLYLINNRITYEQALLQFGRPWKIWQRW